MGSGYPTIGVPNNENLGGVMVKIASLLSLLALATATMTSTVARAEASTPSEDTGPASKPANSRADVNTSNDLADVEILVTAQRRSERTQDVPISISAFSAAQLSNQGITNTDGLSQITPGVVIANTNTFVTPYIRGIGSAQVVLGEGGSVATYIDGVYYPEALVGSYDLGNVESIEVLKGPQGTLFGRNAAGGAISIHTQQPQFTAAGNAEVSYGNYNTVTAHAFQTGPINDVVAFAISTTVGRQDGYIRDLYRGGLVADSYNYGLRGTLLIKPKDELRITFSADYTRINDPQTAASAPLDGYLGETPASLVSNRPYEFIGNTQPRNAAAQSGGLARIDYDLSWMQLSSLTAFRRFYSADDIEVDDTPYPIVAVTPFVEIENVFSQEFQLTSQMSGPFSWISGLYYSNQRSRDNPALVTGAALPGPQYTVLTVKDLNYAAFANGTLTLGDFEITGGVRYNNERKHYNADLNGATVVPGVHHEWTSATPRGVISYHPIHDVLVYASYTEGFKSGAYNALAFPTEPVNPETVHAYEIGAKFSRDFLTLDSAIFYYKRKDIQVETQYPLTGTVLLQNAASGKTKGAELDVTLRPLTGLSVTANVTYLDASYDEFPNALIYIPTPVAPGGIPGSLGNAAVSADIAGTRLDRSPRWSGNLASTYTIPVAGGGRVVPTVNVYETSAYFFSLGNTVRQAGYALVNAEVKYKFPGEKISLGIFGTNLSDKRYLESATPNAFSNQGYYAPPRMYGIRARVEW
jgi:iron complex outermembrane receptor protein